MLAHSFSRQDGLLCRPAKSPHRRFHHCLRRKFVSSSAQKDPGEGAGPAGQPDKPGPPAAPAPPPPAANPADIQWIVNPPSMRRRVLGGLAGLGIILGSNFLGTTSALLSLDGGALAGRLKLDSLIPVNGYKRCVDYQNGFEFLYPAKWLADQRLYYRYAERIEQRNSLDPPSFSSRRRPRQDFNEPTAAFGPPGGSGEENISVVVAPLRPGFRLESMGSPKQAATMFLENIVAPPGSDKTAQLVDAGARRDASGQLYYVYEFTVQSERPRFFRHNLAVISARNDLLYTLNCQAPESQFGPEVEAAFRRAADSFTILSSGSGAEGYPDML